MTVDQGPLERLEARKQAAQKPLPPPLPEPEIRWRAATDDELASCNGAARLAKKGRSVGWNVQAHYARGPLIGADGQPLGIANALVLVFVWDRVEAIGTWYQRKDKWDCSAIYLRGPIVRLNTITMGQWLTGEGPK